MRPLTTESFINSTNMLRIPRTYNSSRERNRASNLNREKRKGGSELNGIKLSEVMGGFGWAVSMGQVAHFMRWTSEQVEVFRSPFFRSRFASSRSVGKSIQGDQPQEIVCGAGRSWRGSLRSTGGGYLVFL